MVQKLLNIIHRAPVIMLFRSAQYFVLYLCSFPCYLLSQKVAYIHILNCKHTSTHFRQVSNICFCIKQKVLHFGHCCLDFFSNVTNCIPPYYTCTPDSTMYIKEWWSLFLIICICYMLCLKMLYISVYPCVDFKNIVKVFGIPGP